MGILSTLGESGPTRQFMAHQSGIAAGMQQNLIRFKKEIISEAGFLYESQEQYKGWTDLATQLESDSLRDQYAAATTLMAVESTRRALEGLRAHLGESVVTGSLGTLVPRILDVVRIFYPNLVAQDLVDIQPLAGQVGEIFVIRPRYDQSVPGVTAGTSQVFQNYPTANNYASEVTSESIGTGDGSATTFSNTLTTLPVRPGTVKVTAAAVTFVDNGQGVLLSTGGSGTIDYIAGTISVTFTTHPASAVNILAAYQYSTETNTSAIRSLSFDLGTVPITAKLHPLTYNYSVASGLAAQAHLALDVQDTLAQLVAQYIKVERDNYLINTIAGAATAVTNLNFDVNMSGVTYDRRTKYGEFELKVDAAESYIQATMGRGGIDFVLCGRDASNVIRQSRGFRPEAIRAPIGPHRIGTLRDGTVAVVKVPNTAILSANGYVFGFKGYMTGDSATILAEWIPMYFSPTFQAPTLVNSQGAFSAYDLFVNQPNYYLTGTLSNYAA